MREHLLNIWLQLLSCSEHKQLSRHFSTQKVYLTVKQDDHIVCSSSATLNTVLQLMETVAPELSFLSLNLRAEQYAKLNSWLKLTSRNCAASSNCQSILDISKPPCFTEQCWPGRHHWIHQQRTNNVMLTNLILPWPARGLHPSFSATATYLCMIFLFAIFST